MKRIALITLILTLLLSICALGACHEHEFGEWTIVYQATCTTAGSQERFCTCGEKQTSTIATIEHSFGEWTVVNQATCSTDGLQKKTCECGKEETEVVPKGHYFTVVAKTEPATCTKRGVETVTCECGRYKGTREFPSLGHDLVQHAMQEPTCTNIGWNDYESCTRCDYTTYYELPITHKLNGTVCEVCDVDYVSAGLVFELNSDGQSYTVVDINGKESHIVIPSTYQDKPVVSIGDGAFSACRDATSVHIPDSITSIGVSAFSGCDKLQSVTIPQGVTSISAHTFDTCSALASICIPKGITSIGDYAFFACENLAVVTFEGDQLQSIGDHAFGFCHDIASITLPNNLTTIANNAFFQCIRLTTVAIPASVTNIGTCPFNGCEALKEIAVDTNNANYTSIDGNLYTKDGKTLVQYALGKSQTTFVVPESVVTIGHRSISGAKNLTSITLSGNVTNVESYAFAGCFGLVEISITSPLETLEDCVFYFCSTLENITLPSTLKNIGNAIFYKCEKLKNINYSGTREQWRQINKANEWDYSTDGTYTITYEYTGK